MVTMQTSPLVVIGWVVKLWPKDWPLVGVANPRGWFCPRQWPDAAQRQDHRSLEAVPPSHPRWPPGTAHSDGSPPQTSSSAPLVKVAARFLPLRPSWCTKKSVMLVCRCLWQEPQFLPWHLGLGTMYPARHQSASADTSLPRDGGEEGAAPHATSHRQSDSTSCIPGGMLLHWVSEIYKV